MYYPLDIGRFLIYPGRKLVGLLGRMKIEVSVVPRLTSILSGHHIIIRQFLSSTIEGREDEVMVLVFLDLTDSSVPVEEVITELHRTGWFNVLEVIKPVGEGLIVDTTSSPLMAGKNRVIIFRDLGYRGLLTEIRNLFGSGGEALLYHVGFHMGLGFAKLHKEFADKAGIKDPARIYQQISCSMFQWAGFGRKEVVELSQDRLVIQVYNSFECEVGKGSVRPYSHLIRGMIAGTLAELFNRSVTVVEDSCIAKGDPFCCFKAQIK